MENIDSKKKIEKKLSEALQSMYMKELFNEEFIDLYIKDKNINYKLKNIALEDTPLIQIDSNVKKEIESLLISAENTSSIKDFETLINKSTEYILIKRMKDLNIL